MSNISKNVSRQIEKEKIQKTGILHLRNCRLKTIPEELFELEWLETLDLSSNRITDISALKKLTGLKYLYLNSNEITDISALERLTELQALTLSSNQIIDISALEKLTGLQYLYLDSNKITDISALEKLTGLRSLDLRSNEITDISVLERLIGLKSLDLNSNEIIDIRPLLPILKKGVQIEKEFSSKGIKLSENPLADPPMSIVEKGSDAVISWFEQKKEGEEPLFEGKLMILGQGGAGKTTFANLLLDPNHEVKPGKLDATLGISVHKGREFAHQNRDGRKIKAHLWDFGGQDIQKMLHQFFITENCLYVLVSDKRAENARFNYWFQIIHLLGPKSRVIVLENPKEIQSTTDNFPLTKYQELFKDLDIESLEVNLKETRGRDKTKWRLLNETIEKKLSALEIVNRPVPVKWTLIRDELDKLRELKKEKYISKDKFYDICSKFGLTRDHSDLCLYYFRELGDLVYFQETGLYNWIFLDHNWLTQGMYYILSDKKIEKDWGKFTRKQAFDEWSQHGYNEAEKGMLLQLLLKDKFDICYEPRDEPDVFITPLLLPNDKPAKWECETNLRFRYQYGFMPHGMFSRLIVRLHEKIDGEIRWKTGVRLTHETNGDVVKAEVQQYTDPEENQRVIDIKLNGGKQGCKHLLQFIRNAIENLHKEFRNMRPTIWAACNCHVCAARTKSGENPSFYKYDMLKAKTQKRIFFVDCEKSGYERVNIGRILNDVMMETAASGNVDSKFLKKWKEEGFGMTQIINGNMAVTHQSGCVNSQATATATVSTQIENIQNMSGEMENLLADIKDERALLKKTMDADEIDVAIRDVEKAEQAVKEIETAQKEGREPLHKTRIRIKGFIDDLSDEESGVYKTLRILRKGKNYGVKIAEIYNAIAGNIGLPLAPPGAIEVIKKL